MKGTFLVLGLLVTGELSFHTTEACVPFFKGYTSVVSGLRFLMHQELQAFNATAGEKVAFEKIQDCYKEKGLRTVFLEPQIMVIFCLPLLTHATNAVRLCTRDRCNHYYMSCDLQLRTETLPTLVHVKQHAMYTASLFLTLSCSSLPHAG
uniref:Uncharacterized protein n=1 Tax=Mus spicilegus TaxID=10103 RepID=A0A8C6HDF9_MUSSI